MLVGLRKLCWMLRGFEMGSFERVPWLIGTGAWMELEDRWGLCYTLAEQLNSP